MREALILSILIRNKAMGLDNLVDDRSYVTKITVLLSHSIKGNYISHSISFIYLCIHSSSDVFVEINTQVLLTLNVNNHRVKFVGPELRRRLGSSLLYPFLSLS